MDAEMIARSLTKAQRRALQGVKQMYSGEHLVNSTSQPRVRIGLVRRGLIEQSNIFPLDHRLTPLGLAVRNHIKAAPDA